MNEVVPVHAHGHVVLEDCMGNDLAIVNNARVSFNAEHTVFDDEDDAGLIGYLMRNGHGSPFEAVTLRFDVKAPLFVFREWHRHRAGHSYNEWSARYSKMGREFYTPARDDIRRQVGKPGAYTFERIEDDTEADMVVDNLTFAYRTCAETYEALLAAGVAKEIARLCLPVSLYSRMKWTCNLRSLMHFCSLRNSEHAQREIRSYAQVVERLAHEAAPVAMRAFEENGRKAP